MDVAISSSSDRSIIQNLDHSLSLSREENFSKRIKKKEKVTDERMPLGRWNSLYIIKILTPVEIILFYHQNLTSFATTSKKGDFPAYIL